MGVIQLRPVTGIHGMREKGSSGQPFMHRLQLAFGDTLTGYL